MSQNLNSAVAVIGIDIGKNSFHVVGQAREAAVNHVPASGRHLPNYHPALRRLRSLRSMWGLRLRSLLRSLRNLASAKSQRVAEPQYRTTSTSHPWVQPCCSSVYFK